MDRPAAPALALLLAALAPLAAGETPSPPAAAPAEGAPGTGGPKGDDPKAADPKDAPPKEAEVTAPVTKGDLEILIEAEGTLEAARRQKAKLAPEEFQGVLLVAEIVENGARVRKGDILLRFDPSALERSRRAAQEELDAAAVRLATAEEDLRNLKARNALSLERSQEELKAAKVASDSFAKFGEEAMLRDKALGVKNREHRLQDRRDELEQLEKMYQGSRLATETKDIVLERTKRDIRISEEFLDLAHKDEKDLLEFDHPLKKRQVAFELQAKTRALENEQASARISEIQKEEAFKRAERDRRDAEERLKRLQGDLEALTIRAEFDGVVRHSGSEPGDRLYPYTTLLELLGPAAYEVEFALKAADLRIVKEGTAAAVFAPDLPDLALAAEVRSIAAAPEREKGGEKGAPRFAVKAAVKDAPADLRPGLRARVEIAAQPLKAVLSIPRTAVIEEKGRTFAKVKAGEKPERREIVLGPGNRDRVQVLRGLSEGEKVVAPEKK